jgi:hypothetical protein
MSAPGCAAVYPPAETQVSNPEERTPFASLNLVIALLVLLVSGNVALLMFARGAGAARVAARHSNRFALIVKGFANGPL